MTLQRTFWTASWTAGDTESEISRMGVTAKVRLSVRLFWARDFACASVSADVFCVGFSSRSTQLPALQQQSPRNPDPTIYWQ